jgi:site-specific DNA recombinase
MARELNAAGEVMKPRQCTNSPSGGKPWTKGAVYKLLANGVYLREAVRKGKSYPGEHKPIVDRAAWDRVHEVLATNAKRRGNEARARTSAPLRGLLRCTHRSSAMTPTHTPARSAVPLLGLPRRQPQGPRHSPVRSSAASEVEALVLGQVRRLLASPELVSRTIAAVRPGERRT